MSNIRLFHPESITANTTSLLSKELTHYVVNVMRLKRGSNLNFFNKEGEWESKIVFLEKDRVEVKFLHKVKESSKSLSFELAICLVKKNPMEIILQKATELGVSKITPIISERTEVKELNYERANKIVIEATEQSNQLNPPVINQVIKLKDFIDNFKNDTRLFFANVNSNYTINSGDIDKNKSICILVRPEGDFSPKEQELILSIPNLISFSLSKNILKTDTAVISAISLVNFVYNDH